jgi:TRAP transporter 4TM/12TM fusion protein
LEHCFSTGRRRHFERDGPANIRAPKMDRRRVLPWLTSIIALYHLVVVAQLPTWLGIFVPDQVHDAISILSALVLIYLTLPGRGRLASGAESAGDRMRAHVPWYDWLLMASAVVGAGYVVLFHENILDYGLYGELDQKGIVLSLMLAIPLLEAVRRTVGWLLVAIILAFVALVLFQRFLPGILYGQGYPITRLLYSAYVSDVGIFGLPLGIAAQIVIIFLIFGALMEQAGASRWFMDLALAVTGWSRGGPAKAAVVASAMFGSISGSPSGNAATTGIFTIPMMVRIGYTPAFAAGVEAVASTGGMILPPVMGAIAFIMADWVGVRYRDVVFAALVPALLYYLIVFVSVHLQARKADVRALDSSELPDIRALMRRGWHHLIPLGVLIYVLLVADYPPGMAGVYTCGAVLAVSFLSKDRADWLTPRRIVAAFQDAVMRWIIIAAITAAVGIIIGALELSGVGINFSRFLVELSGGDLLLTLVFIGIVSLIVGMGLDATPAYITLATLFAPALVDLGVQPIAAHLFVIYWGLASFFTPPVCLAVFVTASIAGSRIWASGWQALQMGIAAFLVPFAFVLNDGLLLQGSVLHIVQAVGTAVLGSVMLAAAIRGFAFGQLSPVQRVLILVGGVLLIMPGVRLALAGAGLGLFALLLGRLSRAEPSPAARGGRWLRPFRRPAPVSERTERQRGA